MEHDLLWIRQAAAAAREALTDYYGTAFPCGMPAAMADLSRVERMSDEEAIEEARQLHLI